jgi:hypothetical protein
MSLATRRLLCDPASPRTLRLALRSLGTATAIAWSSVAQAQGLDVYFPSGVSGYDQQLGVTVLSRQQPLFEAPGVRVGGFMLYPSISESTVYNSNVNGTPGSASWGLDTAGSISAASDWDRNSLGATIGVNNYQFLSLPSESYTDWNVGVRGGYTIDSSQLSFAYYHSSYHQLGTGIATVASESPVPDQTDSARISYTFTFSRLAITPDASFSLYRYGTATVQGSPVDLSMFDRDVIASGVTGRYSLSDEGGLLIVLRDISSFYVDQMPGQPSNNSNSILLLGGLDYQSKSVWRYHLMVGVETREFAASQFPSHTAAVAEGSVIWQPTGLTTVTGSLSRMIEDPQSVGPSGYVLTQGQFTVDHELKRDIILQAHAGLQYVQYLQGSAQTNLTTGVNASWLINRNIRLSFGYSFTTQIGTNGFAAAANPSSLTSGAYSQSIVALTLHLAL